MVQDVVLVLESQSKGHMTSSIRSLVLGEEMIWPVHWLGPVALFPSLLLHYSLSNRKDIWAIETTVQFADGSSLPEQVEKENQVRTG